jgi:hypothetical protein
MAKNWPTVEGCAIYAHVMNAVLENKPESYCAYFTYYFSLSNNGETEYYSGGFSQIFSDEEQAQKWIESLNEKKIPVHFNPEDPNVSSVLFTDLTAKFPVPISAMITGGLEVPGTGSKLPYVLRWPTEMMASLIALSFCIGLLDHLYRILADRPIYPRLAIGLWIELIAVMIPFEIWFNHYSGGISYAFHKTNKGPLFLRILNYSLNIYVAANWLIDGSNFAKYFHLHRDRFDPMMNGAFLALALGNYAASLYRRLDRIEESPISSAYILHHD